MDASAYLVKQGWRGSGHSLDQTNRGISRPLLISKKVDVLGVGLNKHAAVSDQWWLRAYDQGLQALGTGKTSALAEAQKHGVNRGGLYARFVRGEGVAGTLGDMSSESKTQSVVASPTFEGKLATMADQADFISLAAPAAATPVTGEKRKRDATDETTPGVKTKKTKKGKIIVAKKNLEQRDPVAYQAKLDARAAKKIKMRAANKDTKEARSVKLHARLRAEKEKKTTAKAKQHPATEKQARQRVEKALVAKLLAEDPVKLVKYEERAAEKGMTLLDYHNRRQEKFAEKNGLPLPSITKPKSAAPVADPASFVVDTVGIDPSASATAPPTDNIPRDADGKVPMDPTLWEGKMAVRRAERKLASGKAGCNEGKPRGVVKTERQERSVLELLRKCRAMKNSGSTENTVRMENGPLMPVVRITSKDGASNKEEMKLVRRVVGRMGRSEKKVKKLEKKKKRPKHAVQAEKAKVNKATAAVAAAGSGANSAPVKSKAKNDMKA
ncbi:hypothetical protein B0A48_12484 [Cryoendolithus antarcticus]|uniref:G-patch domain-containing protein n=1 Tax=Cryoendolithus antarcticus TaxID=1507870 RepID=A0A1V8SSM2_9PEZI|nr:hypothetical protein B0A48_12484 [Cryoendolithus antarcticus]